MVRVEKGFVVELETLAPAACAFRELDGLVPVAANYVLDGHGGTSEPRRRFFRNGASLREHLSVGRFWTGTALLFSPGQMAALRAQASVISSEEASAPQDQTLDGEWLLPVASPPSGSPTAPRRGGSGEAHRPGCWRPSEER